MRVCLIKEPDKIQPAKALNYCTFLKEGLPVRQRSIEQPLVELTLVG